MNFASREKRRFKFALLTHCSIAFNGGVGERARANARIILEGIRTTTHSCPREANYVVWQSYKVSKTSSPTLAATSCCKAPK